MEEESSMELLEILKRPEGYADKNRNLPAD